MTRNHLRALMAASIYSNLNVVHFGASNLARDALERAEQILDISENGDFPEDLESDVVLSAAGSDRPARPASWFDQQQVALEESLEEIDAAMFSGDSFIDAEGIAYLEWYIGRWVRTLAERRRALQPELEVNEVQPPAPKSRETCGICTGNHRTAMCPEIPF